MHPSKQTNKNKHIKTPKRNEITKKKVKDDVLSPKDLVSEIERLKGLMKVASSDLDFERAIKLRDEINELKKQLHKFK